MLWFRRFTLGIIMDSKDEIFTPALHLKKTVVVFGNRAEAITGVSRWKTAIIFASTFSKLQQTTNQLTTALPSAGHLGAATPCNPLLLLFCHDESWQTKTPLVFSLDAFHFPLWAPDIQTPRVTPGIVKKKSQRRRVCLVSRCHSRSK